MGIIQTEIFSSLNEHIIKPLFESYSYTVYAYELIGYVHLKWMCNGLQ